MRKQLAAILGVMALVVSLALADGAETAEEPSPPRVEPSRCAAACEP